jgi:hypothetical protein
MFHGARRAEIRGRCDIDNDSRRIASLAGNQALGNPN